LPIASELRPGNRLKISCLLNCFEDNLLEKNIALLAACFILASCLAYSSNRKINWHVPLKRKNFQWTAWRFIPEEKDLQIRTLITATFPNAIVITRSLKWEGDSV
jgi:hypothetical protein